MTAPKPKLLKAGASAPSRVHRNMYMSLELIPFEVGIYSTVSEPEGLRKEFLHTEDGYHEVGRKSYDKVTGDVIDDTSQVIKGVATENGVVEITDEEMALATERVCEIVQFVNLAKLTEADQRLICPTKFYQVRPGRIRTGKVSRPNAKAEQFLMLLLTSMKEDSVHALIRVTMRDGEAPKLGLMDWAGHLRILAFENCIREELPLGEVPTDKKLQTMMGRMVKKHTKNFLPANPDQSASQLDKVLQMKAAGGALVPAGNQENRSDHPALDLEAMLNQALKGK